MIPVFLPIGKCAGLGFFCLIQRTDSYFDLPEHHFRNVTGGNTEDRYGSSGIEVQNMGKVIMAVMLIGVNAASGQEHIGNAVDQGKVKAAFQIIAVQLVEKASCFDPF